MQREERARATREKRELAEAKKKEMSKIESILREDN